MRTLYEIPKDFNELFHNGERDYSIINYKKEMNNFEAMEYFLALIGVQENDIEMNDGTRVILKHINYPQLMVIDSSGLGDFYSHSFEVTEYKWYNLFNFLRLDCYYCEDNSSQWICKRCEARQF